MIQIATIKKQHEAEEAGYYSGGFTGGNQYKQTAGVVHEGEFVANHDAVNNPNVLPFLQMLDNAQRNNTVASLTAADVSRSITAPVAAAAGATQAASAANIVVNSPANAQNAQAIERLNQNLEEGIVAVVSLDGDRGFVKQYKHYQKLQNNR